MVASESIEGIYSIIGGVDWEMSGVLRETVNAIFLSYKEERPICLDESLHTPTPLEDIPTTGESPIDKATRIFRESLEASAAKSIGGVDAAALEPLKVAIDDLKIKDVVLGDEIEKVKAQGEIFNGFLSTLKSSAVASARASIVAKSSSNPILNILLPHYEAGKECITTLLCAPPSFGKSHAINKLGESYDVYLKHGCSEDVDEISTALGGPTPNNEESGPDFICVDGVLTQAVRAASEGKNVLFFLDELLRWKGKTLESFLTFLEPIKSGGREFYQLRTRKVIGGALEVLECDTKHLNIIAASNLGIDIPLEAGWSRFTQERVPYSASLCENIGTCIAASYGIDDAPLLANRFQKAMTLSRDLRHGNRLEFPIDFRLLVTACKFRAEGRADRALDWMRSKVDAKVSQWDERSGADISDSLNAAEEVKGALYV